MVVCPKSHLDQAAARSVIIPCSMSPSVLSSSADAPTRINSRSSSLISNDLVETRAALVAALVASGAALAVGKSWWSLLLPACIPHQ